MLTLTVLGLGYIVAWVKRESPQVFIHNGTHGKLLRGAPRYKNFIFIGSISVVLALIYCGRSSLWSNSSQSNSGHARFHYLSYLHAALLASA